MIHNYELYKLTIFEDYEKVYDFCPPCRGVSFGCCGANSL